MIADKHTLFFFILSFWSYGPNPGMALALRLSSLIAVSAVATSMP